MKNMALLLLLVIFNLLNAQSGVDVKSKITPDELKAHVKYLASDKLEGRKPATEGSDLASNYLVEILKENNAKFFNDSPYQEFEIVTDIKLESAYLKINSKEYTENEFTPVSISSNDKVSGELVFAGYGFKIDDDSLKWNDYADVNVKEKVAVILRGAPEIEEYEDVLEDNSSFYKKAMIAREEGAVAAIFVSGSDFDVDDYLMELKYRRGEKSVGIPILHLKRDALNEVLKSYDMSVPDFEAIYKNTSKPKSFALGVNADIKVNINQITQMAKNVIAYLPGTDPVLKDEYVILGGHYDHLGFGGPGSGSRTPDTLAIHNGADDNASGTATVLEIFEKIANMKGQRKRSLIYCAFDAEEMGLLGSAYFVKNPPVDLKNVVFMENLDMIGSMDKTDRDLTVGGSGTAEGLEEMLKEKAEKYNINPGFSPEGLGPSDHASFYAKDIPVMFLFSGTTDVYHTPEDDYELLNYEGLADIGDFAYDVLVEMLNGERLTFTEAGPKERDGNRRSFKVTLGIMPSFQESEIEGLQIDAVMKDRPAEKAGLLKGDVIVKMGEKTIKNIYDYMYSLGDLKKGQEVDVTVIRGEETLTLKVLLF